MTDMQEYTRRFMEEILSQVDPQEILEKHQDAVLLCWEKPGDFCHRQLVADWIEKATGQKVPEITIEEITKQQRLF